MLSSRQLFNESVRHVKATIAIADRVQSGENLADVLNDMLDEKSLVDNQLSAVISMMLVDKFAYTTATRNLSSVETELAKIHESVKHWNAVDVVAVYHHPDLGAVAINPKNSSHFARLDRLNKTELLAVYVGSFGKTLDKTIASKAVDALLAAFEGRTGKVDAGLLKGACTYKQKVEKLAKVPKTKAVGRPSTKTKPKAGGAVASAGQAKADASAGTMAAASTAAAAPVQAVARTSSRMTPMYGVPVTNELFHNGNVEAWKRIIESYKAKHAGLEVLVYYDGERITNLNALFKWGKVKHGSMIQFAVAGEDVTDVAKLQRYLRQGASNMFEAFLRGPVNGVLSLF
ncbi:MAG TPA: hypothetical protein DD477_14065 [Spirochaetaceae bacterium]|nr:hypothetical protein [Spirochaetaceae bacterium]HAW85683.1 hypothetical protein [Spirochaetaceae bacterium]HAX37813.1 hypothetical protein [Spirochaetaceae bacterium]HBO42320.1 hypothetical protein [Spirochaetaceae bacterium]HCQ88308.1 hypothetical protein [Spirochaetaceae bacterium]